MTLSMLPLRMCVINAVQTAENVTPLLLRTVIPASVPTNYTFPIPVLIRVLLTSLKILGPAFLVMELAPLVLDL